MTDTSEGSGVDENQNADEAPKTDYEITGDKDPSEIEAEEAQKAARKAAKKAKEAEDTDEDDEDDEDIEDDDEGDDDDSEDGEGDDADDDDEQDDDDDDEDQSDDEDESDNGRKKRRGGFQKKIDKLEAEIERLNTQLQDNQANFRTVDPFAPEPKRQDFRTDRDFEDAHTDWRLDQREAKRQADAKKENFKLSQKAKVSRYEAKTQELRKDKSYAKTIESYDGPLTIGMQQALIDSEYGPEVALEIAKNPKIGQRMANMSLVQLNKEVARLEVKIEGKLEGKQAKNSQKSKSQKKVKSSAPPPVKPVKASSKNNVQKDDESYEDYLKRRQKRRGF